MLQLAPNSIQRRDVTVLLVRDLLTSSGRERKSVPFVADRALIDYAPPEFAISECLYFVHNGEIVSKEQSCARRVAPGDSIVVSVEPNKGKTFAYVLGALEIAGGLVLALAVPGGAAFGVGLIASGVGTIGAALLTQTPKLGIANNARSWSASPTFNPDGYTNTYTAGTIIAALFGRHRFAGHVIQQYLDVDTDGKSYLYTLVSLGHGPIHSIGGITEDKDGLQGSEIPESFLISGSPARNYKGVRVTTRLGSWSQKPIIEFTQNKASQGNGGTVSYGSPQTMTTKEAVTNFEVILTFPNGIYSVNSNGAKIAYKIEYTIRWRETGTDTWAGEQTVTLNKVQGAQFSTKWAPTAPPMGVDSSGSPVAKILDVQVERLTKNDDQFTNKQSTFYWNALNEIRDAVLPYRGYALVGWVNQATDQLQGQIPQYSHVYEGLSVHYWDGVSETNPTFKYGYTDGYDTKEDVRETVTEWININETSGTTINSLVGWKFDSAGTRTLRGLRVKLKKSSTQPLNGTIVAQLRTNAGGSPSGTILATTEPFSVDKIGTNEKIVDLAFATPYSIDSTVYPHLHIVIVPSWSPTSASTWSVLQLGLYESSNSSADCETYTGSWSAKANRRVASTMFYKGRRPGANPAWIAFEAGVNDIWGKGKVLKASNFDLASLLSAADDNDACYDEVAGVTPIPRWEVGLPIDVAMSYWDLLGKLGALSRTKFYVLGNKIHAVVWKPREMTQIFTAGSIVRDSVEFIDEDTSEHPTITVVQYKNEETNWNEDAESHINRAAATERGRITQSFNAYGVTSAARAKALAIDALNQSTLTKALTLTIPSEAVDVLLGEVVGIQHYILDLKTDGSRAVDATSSTLTLDRYIGDTIYKVSVRTFGTGQDVIQTRTVTSQTTETLASGVEVTKITVSPNWNGGDTPVAGTVYGLTKGDSSIDVVQKFQIDNLVTGSDLQCSLTLSKYDDTLEIFNNNPGDIPEFTDELPLPNRLPAAATDLKLIEVTNVGCGDLPRCGIEASWDNPQAWNKSEIWIRPSGQGDAGGWKFVGESWDTTKLITDEYFSYDVATWEVCIRTVTKTGARSHWDDAPRKSITIQGPWAPPPDVTTFAATQVDKLVSFKWTEPTATIPTIDDLGNVQHHGAIKGYQIREGRWWSTARIVTTLATGSSFLDIAPPDGTRCYWIAAISYTGIRSLNPKKITLRITDNYSDEVIDVNHESAATGGTFPGTKTNLAFDNTNQYLKMSASTATYQLARQTLTRGLRSVFVDVEAVPSDQGGRASQQHYPARGTTSKRRAAGGGWAQNPVDGGKTAAASISYGARSHWSRGRYANGRPVDLENNISVTVEYRISTDGSTFTSWATLTNGQVLDFTDIEVRVQLVAQANPIIGNRLRQRLGLRKVRLRAVTSRIIQCGRSTTPSSSFVLVIFPFAFPTGSIPRVTVAGQSLNGGDIINVFSVSNAGFRAQGKSSAGATIARDFDYIAIL